MRFVDEAIILIKAGNGGRGCLSFRREKYIPRGGPDGGDGGGGGDIVFRTNDQLLTLYDFRHHRIWEAQNGRPGSGALRNGRSGEVLEIEVPLGTLIYEVDEETETEKLIVDLSDPDATFLIAKGGRGGKGNAHFKSSTLRAPRFSQPGEDGVSKRLRLELKIMADVGLLGLPNAGKSTFITKVSAAKPKIGAYPFTTITPNLGVIQDEMGNRLVIADIPGLIEGAHTGLGLGGKFLRHVERTKFLLHILSAEDIDPENPMAGFVMINEELRCFNPELTKRKQVLAVNKIDLVNAEVLDKYKKAFEKCGAKVFYMSAKDNIGVEELLAHIWDLHLNHYLSQ